MARMGQCFSTSLDAVGFAVSEETFYDDVDDVKTDDQKYCFSDGVGRISEELAAEVCTLEQGRTGDIVLMSEQILKTNFQRNYTNYLQEFVFLSRSWKGLNLTLVLVSLNSSDRLSRKSLNRLNHLRFKSDSLVTKASLH